MLTLLARRLMHALPILLGVSVLVFVLIQLMPGTIADLMVPPGAPPELIREIGALYGFDKPVWEQYLRWLGQILTGNMGLSVATGRPVAGEVLPALANTLKITFFAAALGFGCAIVFGTIAALFHKRWPDRVLSTVMTVGLSVPNYWLAILCVAVFSVQLQLLPPQGMGEEGLPLSWAQWRYMILPIVALSMIPMGVVGRLVRASVLDVLSQEFVGALAARGLSRGRILLHVARNAAPAVLALMGLQFGYLIGGSILVETVFNWPGTGRLLNQAIFTRDVTMIQSTVLVLAAIFVAVNLLVDLLQGLIDPRMRR
ncbi:MAG: ABC transporter permease [Burkholderiaceae bacterium]